jgi:four helix bundle protein
VLVDSFMTIHTYKELVVWQKGMDLVVLVYQMTTLFPKDELYGLASQMKRAAVSIPSNIAEGRSRGTRNDYVNFLRIAYASGAELETQIELAKKLFHIANERCEKVELLLTEVMKMLNVMLQKLKANQLAAIS